MSIFGSIGKAVSGGLGSFWDAGKSVAGFMVPKMFSAAQGYATSGGSPWGALGGFAGGFGADLQNEANSAQAERMMHFQQQMSNTAYQRAMRDMRLAGLNPIFAYQAGGASTPSGAQASMVNVGDAAATTASKVANTSIAYKTNVKQLENIQKDTDVKATQEKLNNSTVSLQSSQAGKNQSDAELSWVMKQYYDELRDRTKYEGNSAFYQQQIDEKVAELQKKILQFQIDNPKLWQLNQVGQTVGTWLGNAGSAARVVAPKYMIGK